MADKKKAADKKAAPPAPPTIITLTLPAEITDDNLATLVLQRGDLAHMRCIPRHFGFADLADQIHEGLFALAAVEAAPPVIPAPPPPPPAPARPASTYVPPKREPVEPMIDIPLIKGKQSIKASHLQLIGEQTDEAAMREAMLIAGKLIDGKLWDGKSPIGIDDVYGVQKRLKYLAAKDLVMFSLEDFAQRVEVKAPAPDPVIEADEIEEEEADEELEEVNE